MFKSRKVILVSVAFCVILWVINIGRFARTAGIFGGWDLFCSGMLGASVVTALFWLLALRKGQASRFSTYGWLLVVALLGGAASAIQYRDRMAEAELLTLGIVSAKDSALGYNTRWLLEKVGMPTLVHSGHWGSSGEPSWGQRGFSRAASLLAICGATHVNVGGKEPVTDLEPLRQLRGLKSIWLGCSAKTGYEVFAELPELLDLVIEVSDPSPELSPLKDALTLERLNIFASECGGRPVDLEGFTKAASPGPPRNRRTG